MTENAIRVEDIGIRLLLQEAAAAADQGRTSYSEALYRQALRKAELESHNLMDEILQEMASFLESTGSDSEADSLRKRINRKDEQA